MARFEDTFPPYRPFGSRTLRLQTPNLRGTDVAVLQAVYNLMLKTMNPPLGPMGPPITLDGIFGPATRQAVINIQSYFGISADGVAGTNTYFLFGQGVGANTTYGGPVFGSRTIVPGNSGGDVTVLQNRLNCFRYAGLLGHPATGTYDSPTGTAVLAFKSDAIANGQTGLLLNGNVGDGTFDAFWLYTFAGGRGIFTGRNGFDVVFIQVILRNLGFYSGRITGYYSTATRNAVIAFQRAAGISADGVVGQQTFYQIGLRNPVPAPRPLRLAWPAQSSPPSNSFTDCSVTLTPDIVPGGSFWIRQGPDSQATFIVSAIHMPSPDTFDPSFDRYWYTIQDVIERPMSLEFAALGFWTGVHEGTDVVLPIPPTAALSIAAGDDEGPKGPAVLSGSMADCQGASDAGGQLA